MPVQGRSRSQGPVDAAVSVRGAARQLWPKTDGSVDLADYYRESGNGCTPLLPSAFAQGQETSLGTRRIGNSREERPFQSDVTRVSRTGYTR